MVQWYRKVLMIMYVDAYLCVLLVWGCFSWFELQFHFREIVKMQHTVIFFDNRRASNFVGKAQV